jgi:hypothetical protein
VDWEASVLVENLTRSPRHMLGIFSFGSLPSFRRQFTHVTFELSVRFVSRKRIAWPNCMACWEAPSL